MFPAKKQGAFWAQIAPCFCSKGCNLNRNKKGCKALKAFTALNLLEPTSRVELLAC